MVTALIQAMSDVVPNVREAAATALAQLGHDDPKVVTALVATVSNLRGCREERIDAAAALRQLGREDPELVAALVEALGVNDPIIRTDAAAVLGHLGCVEQVVVTALVEA